MLGKSSKFLFIFLFIMIMLSVGATYMNTLVLGDFTIINDLEEEELAEEGSNLLAE
jgi:hypothetical protein